MLAGACQAIYRKSTMNRELRIENREPRNRRTDGRRSAVRLRPRPIYLRQLRNRRDLAIVGASIALFSHENVVRFFALRAKKRTTKDNVPLCITTSGHCVTRVIY